MNNATTIALAAIVVILMSATLTAGSTSTAAFAYKKDNGKGNGNTVTIQKDKKDGTESGFDNTEEQEAENLICTHPSAICEQSTPSVAQEQTALEISGQGTGNEICPPAHAIGLGDITFSATRQNGIFSGTFTMIINSTHTKSASITSGNIQSGSYTVQGTETVDNTCFGSTTVPTAITINGQCGTGVTINFRVANGETATFTGNVNCVSS